jgi:hypothetical protein
MISILTPSRSRPELAKRMMDSAFKSAGCEIDIKFYLNADDPLLQDYLSFLNVTQYIIGPNQSTCYSWNLMAEKATHDILFLVGDDAQFDCANWGLKVINAFNQYPDKIACIYPRAPSVGKKKNPHFCLHKNWINTVGYFLPPVFYHWYVDTWIREVAMSLGRFHLIADFEMPIENIKDVVNRTYHHSWMRERDDWIWDKTVHYRDADVALLQKFIENFK